MSKPSEVETCSKCGEEASGPGAKDAIARHMAKKHKAVKK